MQYAPSPAMPHQRGMNIITNMSHFVAPRSLPAHAKLASNSIPAKDA